MLAIQELSTSSFSQNVRLFISPAKACSHCFVLCIVLIAVLSSLKLVYDIFILLFSPFLILFWQSASQKNRTPKRYHLNCTMSHN